MTHSPLLKFCRDAQGTRSPPFSVFAGDMDASTVGSYTVLDNTNCTATPSSFTPTSQTLAVPCPRQGRYVVIKATGGPLVLCEVSVYGERFDQEPAMKAWHGFGSVRAVLCCAAHS